MMQHLFHTCTTKLGYILYFYEKKFTTYSYIIILIKTDFALKQGSDATRIFKY